MTDFDSEKDSVQGHHIIFTDGACSGNPGLGGWAYVHCSPDLDIQEGSGFEFSTTNNRMELMAVIKCLQEIKDSFPVIIYTDSVYVIRGITQWIFGWQRRGWKNAEGQDVINQDLWRELSSLVRSRKIEWRYVRGHSGFVGNERVDVLAVAESKRRPLPAYEGPLSDYPVSLFPLPPKVPLPEMKKSSTGLGNASPAYYVSYVNGTLEQHKTWTDCQSRVQGVSNAKFKKIQNDDELAQILNSWGVDSQIKLLKR